MDDDHDHHDHEHDHDHDYIDHHVDDYDDCEVIMQNSSDRNHLGGGGIIGASLTHTSSNPYKLKMYLSRENTYICRVVILRQSYNSWSGAPGLPGLPGLPDD